MLLLLGEMPWQKLFIHDYLIGIFVIIASFQNSLYCCPGNSVVFHVFFSRLVDKINKSVGQDLNSQIQIGLLDIYGFECFKENR